MDDLDPICPECRTRHGVGQACASVPSVLTTSFVAASGPALKPPPGPPPRTVGPYRILRELGRGGMGVVLLTLDPADARPLALKVLATPLTDQVGVQRFRREFRAISRLDHPNVVRVFDSGLHEGRPYFTMELVEGPSLRQRLRELWTGPDGSLPPEHAGELLRLLLPVVEALAYVHRRGLVHCDLKPDNVLLGQPPAAGGQRPAGSDRPLDVPRLAARTPQPAASLVPKLADFGLARDPEASLSSALLGSIGGTAAYMAPEQILGLRDLDGRADLYSLGVMLYEALTGRRPFQRPGPLALLHQHLHERPPAPRELAPWLDPPLEELVLRLMAREREDRPASAEEVLGLLERRLAGAPAAARSRKLTGLLTPPLAGRDELPAWLASAAAGLASPRPQASLLLIEGEAGSGKSRLLEAVGAWARGRLMPVCRAAGEQERRTPFSAFGRLLEMAAQRLAGVTEAERAELAPAAALAPALAQALGLDAPPAATEGALGAALRVLERCLEGRPVVQLLDDLHWADELSLDFLETLVRGRGALPLLLVAAVRPEAPGAGPRLERLLEAAGEGRVRRWRLRPLDRAELAGVAAAALGGTAEALTPPLLAAVVDAAQGLPAQVLQALQRLVDAGRVAWEGERLALASAEATQALAGPSGAGSAATVGRLDGLPGAEREVLELCAVFGKGLPLELMAGILGQGEPALLDALNAWIRRRVLVPVHGPEGEGFAFAQASARDQVYRGLGEPRRRALHRRVAQALRARFGEADAWLEPLAYHHRAAFDVEEALRLQALCVRKALRLHALRDALRLAEEGLELATLVEPAERPWQREHQLRALQSEAWYRLGRLDEALRSAAQALEVAQAAGDLRQVAAVENNLGILHAELRQFAQARRHYETALGLAREQGLSDLEPWVLGNLGWLQLKLGQGRRARGHLEQALELGGRLQDEALRVTALLNLAELDLEAADLASARTRLALAAAAGKPGLEAEAVQAEALEAAACRMEGRWVRAERVGREALEAARKVGEAAGVQRAALELAELELARGRPELAEAWLAVPGEAAVEPGAEPAGGAAPEQPGLRLRLRRLEAEPLALRGRWREALERLQRLHRRADVEHPVEGLRVSVALGRMLGLVGRTREALRVLAEAERLCVELEVAAPLTELRHAVLELELEAAGAAPALLERLDRLGEEARARGETAWVRRIEARAAAARGQAEAPVWREAREAFAGEEAAADLARLVLLQAEALMRAGRQTEAGRLLVERAAEVLAPGLPWLEVAYGAARAAADGSPAGAEAAARAQARLLALVEALAEEDRDTFLLRPAVQALGQALASRRGEV